MSLNIFRLIYRGLKSNFVDLKYPYRLNFILTYKCNLSCSMCNIWKKKSDNELTTEEVDKFFYKNNYFSWVDLSGGEIFLRPDIFDIAKIIIDRCPHLYLLHFPTNGFMTDRILLVTGKILTLFKQKLIITISIDGSPQLHDEIRGVKGAWQKAVNTYKMLKKIKKRNLEVYFGITISDTNVQTFMDAYYTAKNEIPDLEYDDLHFNFIHNSPHYYEYNNAHIVNEDRYKKALEEIISTRKNRFYPVHILEKDYLILLKRYLKTGKNPLNPCEALSSSCFIEPNADVYACSIYNKKIGNLKDEDFDLGKILHSQEAKRLRSQIKQSKCPQCWTACEAYTAIMAHKVPFLKK